MLFRLFPLLFEDPLEFLLLLGTIGISLLVAITVHEFSHALMAYRLGDYTAKRLGRLSPNPLVHLDPMGTMMLLVVGIGWGKPVPFNPYLLRNGARRGGAMVAAAGPLSNLITAGIFALLLKLSTTPWNNPLQQISPFSQGDVLPNIFFYIIFFNIILAIFNLIPLSPLDGFRVALGLLPRELSYSLAKLERYGPAILLSVVFFDVFMGTGILWRILQLPANLLGTLLVGRPLL